MGGTPQTQNTNANPHEVGWLEKRWRMLKSGVQAFAGYFLKPKTYMYAAIFAGVGLMMGFAPPTGIGIAMYVAKMATIGAVFNMTIDMFKEGKKCDAETKTCHQAAAHQQQVAGNSPAQQKKRSPYDVDPADDLQQLEIPHEAAEVAQHLIR